MLGFAILFHLPKATRQRDREGRPAVGPGPGHGGGSRGRTGKRRALPPPAAPVAQWARPRTSPFCRRFFSGLGGSRRRQSRPSPPRPARPRSPRFTSAGLTPPPGPPAAAAAPPERPAGPRTAIPGRALRRRPRRATFPGRPHAILFSRPPPWTGAEPPGRKPAPPPARAVSPPHPLCGAAAPHRHPRAGPRRPRRPPALRPPLPPHPLCRSPLYSWATAVAEFWKRCHSFCCLCSGCAAASSCSSGASASSCSASARHCRSHLLNQCSGPCSWISASPSSFLSSILRPAPRPLRLLAGPAQPNSRTSPPSSSSAGPTSPPFCRALPARPPAPNTLSDGAAPSAIKARRSRPGTRSRPTPPRSAIGHLYPGTAGLNSSAARHWFLRTSIRRCVTGGGAER